MNIEYTNTGDNTARIQVTVDPSDYKDPYESELKSYQKKVNLKGFRKGKTPKSMLTKMYGTAILSDIVTKKLQDKLFEYLDEEKIEILGQPIPSESQEPIHFDVAKDQEYTFIFDLGLKPEFELADLSRPFHYYDVVVAEENIDKELEALQRRGGHHEHVKSDFEDGDLITFNAWELEDGEIKKDGLETEFQVMVDTMKEDFKSKVLPLKVGDSLDFDIYQVEDKLSEDGVRKYLMNLEGDEADREVNSEFRAEIVDATRDVLAELDEEFLTMAFGDEITTEEQAREYIREELKKSFDQQANSMLYQEVHDILTNETEIDLPAEFLKKWLMQNQSDSQDSQQTISEDEIDKRYEEEFKDSLRWQLISDKLSGQYEVSVSQDEVLEELGRRIQQYLPGQQLTQDVYNSVLQSLAKDEQQVNQAYSTVRSNKMFDAIREDLTLEKEEITQEDFSATMKDWAEAQRSKGFKGQGQIPEEEETWDEEE